MIGKAARAWSNAVTRAQLRVLRMLPGSSTLSYLDIGASAMTKPRVALAFSQLSVVAFDPDPRSESDFKRLGFNVQYYPYAVAGDNGPRTLYLTRKSHCSSLLQPIATDDERYQVEREIEVECRQLDEFDIQAEIIKIDVQGAELEILQNAVTALSFAHAVELEVWFSRKYRNQARIDELQAFMAEQGFQLAGLGALYYDRPWDQSGIAFGDILFVRVPQTVEDGKIVLASLVDAAIDPMIWRFVSPAMRGLGNRAVLFTIAALGLFKAHAPTIR